MAGLGSTGESLVAEHYRQRGFRVLEKNYIFPKGKQQGELDLVVLKNNELVFVEVKTRKSNRFGSPFEAVDQYKQAKLVKTAKLYLMANPQYADYEYRIDVAAVDVDNLQNPVIILENAIGDVN